MHDHAPTRAEKRTSQTAAARQAWLTKSAERAIDDPAQLGRAARTVRVALERKRLRLAGLTGTEAA